jgi:DNA-binding LytR/AlgR family response regulator
MKKYSCIIIDDEELSRELLEDFVSRIDHIELRGNFRNPLEAIPIIRNESIDITFLDIQMPEMTGIEFLKSFSNTSRVIFTTAYDQYALEGYELSVIDYLLKPFSFSRFLRAINKATELIDLKNDASAVNTTASLYDDSSNEFLSIRADYKVHRLYLKDILYVQSMREYVVYFSEQDKIMSLGSLKSLEEKLPTSDFIRIHKSYIVAKNRVKSLEGNQLHIDGITLPIGASYRNQVKNVLFNN